MASEELELPYDVNELLGRAKALAEKLYYAPNVSHPSEDEVRVEAEKHGRVTRYGSLAFISTVRNRSAWLTAYLGSPRVMQRKLNRHQRRILLEADKTIEKVRSYVRKTPLICVERVMGRNPFFNPRCILYLSTARREMARLAYMFTKLLFPVRDAPGPKLYLIDIPEWHENERQILVLPEVGVTFVLGTDYFGEIKKGFLRMAMWYAKQEGMLGLHAGAKILKARDRTGRIRKYSVLFLGLSATGKTTHSCHDHNLCGQGEDVEIVQDDVVFLRMDGSALGAENAFYIKTEGLTPETQKLLYKAALSPETVYENVVVDLEGEILLDDYTLTSNGRAVIPRSEVEKASSDINLPPLSELDGMLIFFITRRNTILPIVSKLTAEQAAAAFMLGESVETSAGNPARAGESIRVVGTNPFIIGDEGEEGLWFYRFLKKNEGKVQCFMINTGGVGEIAERLPDGKRIVKRRAVRIQIPETASIIRAIARGEVEWKKEKYFGTLTAVKVEGVDLEKFNPEKYYPPEEIERQMEKLKAERRSWLNQFETLIEPIKKALS